MTRELTRRARCAEGTLVLERRLITPGASRAGQLAIAQRFEVTGRYPAVLVTGRHWFASLVTVHRGELGFRDGHGYRPQRSPFLLYLPPGALVRMPLTGAAVETIGIAGNELPSAWPQVPLAVPCALDQAQALQVTRVADSLSSASARNIIDADIGVDPRASTLRRILFERALAPNPVGHAARLSGAAPAVLSRRFVAHYGLTAREYCQRVRIISAVFTLFGGLSIAHAALDSGWQDLSRFYRQFRRHTSETPGRYRAAARPGVK